MYIFLFQNSQNSQFSTEVFKRWTLALFSVVGSEWPTPDSLTVPLSSGQLRFLFPPLRDKIRTQRAITAINFLIVLQWNRKGEM